MKKILLVSENKKDLTLIVNELKQHYEISTDFRTLFDKTYDAAILDIDPNKNQTGFFKSEEEDKEYSNKIIDVSKIIRSKNSNIPIVVIGKDLELYEDTLTSKNIYPHQKGLNDDYILTYLKNYFSKQD